MPEVKNDVEALLDEHRGCLKLVAKVEKNVEAEPGAIESDELLDNLHKLARMLRRHFQGEEEGFFKEIPLEQPWLAENFQRLGAEHLTIMDSLQGLIADLEKPEGSLEEDAAAAFKIRVKRLILTMRRHEAEENELVMDAHWFTLGSQD